MSIKPFLNQNYERIKAECLKSNKLFEDDKFPANDSSIYRKVNFIHKDIKIEWIRPHEIFQNPKFIINGISGNDLDQGSLGNCWVSFFKKKKHSLCMR